MKRNPLAYPIVIRVVNGYVEASQPDLEIYRVKGRFNEVSKADLGDAILDVMEAILARIKGVPEKDWPMPSRPSKALGGFHQYVGVNEAARMLGVSAYMIREMCKRGELQYKMTAGGHHKIKLEQDQFRQLASGKKWH